MKTKNLVLLLLAFGLTSFHQGGYETAMKNTLDQLAQATTREALLTVANKFERIGRAEKDKWLPFYYMAFAKTVAATLEENPASRDNYLDEADAAVDNLKTMPYDNVEVLALQAFIRMIRISVDPATRGQHYATQAASLLEEANAIRADNPRVVLMMAQLQYGSAMFFNADTGPACDRFKQALALLVNEKSTAAPLAPAWGRAEAEKMVAKCAG